MSFKKLVTNFTAIILMLSVTNAEASNIDLLSSIYGEEESASLGWSVATDAGYTVVGSPRDSENNPQSGAGYLYEHGYSSGTKFFPYYPEEYEHFGWDVDIREETIVVGAPQHHFMHSGNGRVLRFDNLNTDYSSDEYNSDPTSYANDHYGAAVALNEDAVVIGARWDQTGGQAAGAVFDSYGNSDYGDEGNTLGRSLDADDWNDIVAGAREGDYVKVYDDGLLDSNPRVIQNPNDQKSDLFGVSVAIDSKDELILVGAPGYNNEQGAVYIFDIQGTLEDTLYGESEGDRFGESVALDYGLALIGAPHYSDSQGTAYLYDVSDVNNYSYAYLEEQILSEDGGMFGFSVDLDYTDWDVYGVDYYNMVIGAPYAEYLSENAGAAYMYETSVPEPAPLLLIGMGVVSLVSIRRYQKQKN